MQLTSKHYLTECGGWYSLLIPFAIVGYVVALKAGLLDRADVGLLELCAQIALFSSITVGLLVIYWTHRITFKPLLGVLASAIMLFIHLFTVLTSR